MKKFLALVLTAMMALALLPAMAGAEDVVELKWVQVGGGMPANYDAWKANLDAYLEEKIGAHINMEIVSWGDWDNRRNVIVNTNEAYDILFTNLNTFTGDVHLGAFADLTDVLPTAAPELYDFIPEMYWDACRVDGKIYAVPAYKDSSATQYFVWDQTIADKYEIDYNNIHTLQDATEALKAVKEGEGITPFYLATDGLGALTGNYDAMETGLPAIGVRYDDAERKVVATFEQDDIMADLATLHEWYDLGIINADAATLAETPKYRFFGVAQGWSAAATTVWGPQMDCIAVATQWGDTIVSNGTVQGSLSCISAGSDNVEKALELLQLVNTDSYVRDSLYYGLEGDDWDYAEDGRLHRHKTDWTMAGYTQGTFFNVTQLDEVDFNQWDEVRELNENAVPSVLLGFSFDSSEVTDELANCMEIYRRYKSELMTGTVAPDEIVPAMMDEMRGAGFDKIVEAAQAQIDATDFN